MFLKYIFNIQKAINLEELTFDLILTLTLYIPYKKVRTIKSELDIFGVLWNRPYSNLYFNSLKYDFL